MTRCDCDRKAAELGEQRFLLLLLFGLNFSMFFIELIAGMLASSSGLLADSIDMLADAAVYAIAYWAVGKAQHAKNSAAMFSGVCQLLLAVAVAGDVYRRFSGGNDPEFLAIILIASLALAINIACVLLLNKHRHGEIHMRASWLFSVSDVLANTGVIVGGVLVGLTGQAWPDLLIGAVLCMLIAKSGIKIIIECSPISMHGGH